MISTTPTMKATGQNGTSVPLVDVDNDGSCGFSYENGRPPFVSSASALASLDGPMSISVQNSASESGQSHVNYKLELITTSGQHPDASVLNRNDRHQKSCDFFLCKLDLRHIIDRKVDLNEMTNLEFLTEGSHSEIYGANWHGESVIIKILSSRIPENARAIREFNVECELLSRLNHPNIARIQGAGNVPRPFIVMERLKDLSQLLKLNSPDAPLGTLNIFRPPTFKFPMILQHAKELASALNYLHSEVHPLAMIIHRDLKPENLGLTADGVLKLFDFGLCRCVQKRQSDEGTYQMTGCAGSLRYMAPEVVLKKPYTEKVDVYSYGLVIWAIAKNDNPYKYYDRETHRSRVVLKGERPELYSQWPKDFRDLLTMCWHNDPAMRPTFEEIHVRLTSLTTANPSYGVGMLSLGAIKLAISNNNNNNNNSSGQGSNGEARRMSSVSTQSGSSGKSMSTTTSSDKGSTKKIIGQALRSIFTFSRTAGSK